MPFIYAELERILDRNFHIHCSQDFSTGEATFSNPERCVLRNVPIARLTNCRVWGLGGAPRGFQKQSPYWESRGVLGE